MTKKPIVVLIASVFASPAVWAPHHHEADLLAPRDHLSIFPPVQHMPDEEPRWPPGRQVAEAVTSTASGGTLDIGPASLGLVGRIGIKGSIKYERAG